MGVAERDYMRALLPWRSASRSAVRADQFEEQDTEDLFLMIGWLMVLSCLVPHVGQARLDWFRTNAGMHLSLDSVGLVFVSPLMGLATLGLVRLRSRMLVAGLLMGLGSLPLGLTVARPEWIGPLCDLRWSSQAIPWTVQWKEFLFVFACTICIGLGSAPHWLRFGLGATCLTAALQFGLHSETNAPSLVEIYRHDLTDSLDRTALSAAAFRVLPHLSEEGQALVLRNSAMLLIGKGVQILAILWKVMALLSGLFLALRVTLSRETVGLNHAWLGAWIASSMACWIGEFFWSIPYSSSMLRTGAAFASVALDSGALMASFVLLPIGTALLMALCLQWAVTASRGGQARRAAADAARLDKLLVRIHRDGGTDNLSARDRRFLAKFRRRDSGA